ncbi:MAG: cation-translocating P-type ATPase [Nitrososphaerota archaeon]|nr:cation-translocating P-type ATPase [Candidatus Calditenuaceae archaeon]MDW8073772.1 cation-translocating P-type ATPase [Nitrososphaerota archaeon]
MAEKQYAWHSLEASDCLRLLGADPDHGLSGEEARQRLQIFGPNKIEEGRRVSPLRILLKQFRNLMILILIVATAIAALLGEVLDSIVILVIILLAAALGFWQEFRSERIIEALRGMMTPTCNVLRDGVMVKVKAEEVVPGDILLLEAGDRVVADARVIYSQGLQVYEAALTGESIPVAKTVSPTSEDTPVPDRVNMVYAGTTVTSGKGRAVVTATGMRMEFGKIAKEVMEIREEKTPLEMRMEEVARNLGKIILVIIAVIALVELVEVPLLGGELTYTALITIFMFAVSLAVAAVPEALPAIVTSTLSVGMWILARRNSVARSMTAVETLGSTEVICSDKTGTITKGEMVAREVFLGGRFYSVPNTSSQSNPSGSSSQQLSEAEADLKKLALAAVLSSDAVIKKGAKGFEVYGDPTEGALVLMAEALGVDSAEVRARFRRIGEIPFSSERKRMTTITSAEDALMAYMKGAPEVVVGLCDKVLVNGSTEDLTEEWRERLLRANEEMASRGLRVLAVAERSMIEHVPEYSEEYVEQGFVMLGLVGIIDPPRPEVKEAVERCRAAKVRPVMITGDHRLTALAVAKEVSIYREGDIVVTGAELSKMSDKELEDKVEKISVYARVAPSDKLRIVEAWKKRGKTVAMTGDGVNDAPALKRADIGVAMGVTGTEVAKEASDLVLLDDNFSTIVKAVELGRWIYDNIKKYLAYLLEANFVEIAVIAISALIILPFSGLKGEELLPLLPVQILYINLATDGLPAIALGFTPPEPDLMRRPPRPRGETVFTRDVKEYILRALLVEPPLLLLGFMDALPLGIEAARSRMFLMFVFIELAIALNTVSLSQSIFKVRPHKLLIITILWEIAMITVLTIIPVTREALHILVPGPRDIAWIAAGATTTFVSIELLKRFEISRLYRAMRGE